MTDYQPSWLREDMTPREAAKATIQEILNEDCKGNGKTSWADDIETVLKQLGDSK